MLRGITGVAPWIGRRRRTTRWVAFGALACAGILSNFSCAGDEDNPATTSTSTSASTGAAGGGGSAGGSPGKCAAPPDAPNADSLVHLGRAEGDDFIEVLDVVADHPLVYACTSVKGFNIWDASGEGAPALLAGGIAPPGLVGGGGKYPHCQHVGLDPQNKRAVITNRGDELQPTPFVYLLDVSNPAAPAMLKGWTGADSIEGVAISGNRIYAAAHSSGILVFEDAGGASLTEIGRFSDAQSDAWQPVLVGQHLFVAEGDLGVRVYDVAGDIPVPIASVPIPGSSKDIVIHEGKAFVAASSRVAAIDIANPAAPALLGEVETEGTAIALAVGVKNTLLVAEWDRIRGYDISDPAAMKRELSEVLPTGKAFSRALTIDAAPAAGRVYPGEWTGVHAYRQEECAIGPDLETSPDQISFASVPAGDFDVRAVILKNQGNRPLKITGITADNPAVTVNTPSLEIDAGKAKAIEITFKPASAQAVKARVTIASDDPDDPLHEVRVSGNLPGVDVGDPLPAFALVDTEGKTWDSTALKGNIAVLSYFATF
jgi:hypothetical protein